MQCCFSIDQPGTLPPWCLTSRRCGNFPTPFPVVDGADIRRSDMVWSLLNRYAGARDVLRAQLPVRQIRSAAPNDWSVKGSFATMEQDLLGHAFYSSLRDLLDYRAAERSTNRGMPKGKSIIWNSPTPKSVWLPNSFGDTLRGGFPHSKSASSGSWD